MAIFALLFCKFSTFKQTLIAISHHSTNNFLTTKSDFSALERVIHKILSRLSRGAVLKNKMSFIWSTKVHAFRCNQENAKKIR